MSISREQDHPRLRRVASFVKEAALETLWPTRCAICDAAGDLICPQCRRSLPFIDVNHACPICGAPYGLLQCTECNDTMLAAAQMDELPVDAMASTLLADEGVRRIVKAYKDSNERRLGSEIASMMARCIPPEWRHAFLTYIPATAEAVRRRGFDHAELIAREVTDLAQMDGGRLFARPESVDQRKLGRHERQRNMAERFALLPGASVPSKVLVLDDICTTGATLFAAAQCLRLGGAQEVYALAFAKVLATS